MINIINNSITLFLIVALWSIINISVVTAAPSYPVQKFRIDIYNTNQNINASGDYLIIDTQNGKEAEKWTLNYLGPGLFNIVNSSNGQLLSANSQNVFLAKNKNIVNQQWKIEGVQKDIDGYYLYYKISSNLDDSKVLTFNNGKGFSITEYSGSNYQKFKLNLDGLEGFAANCKTNTGEKAGTIGGLLGETVFVSTANQLEAELKTLVPKKQLSLPQILIWKKISHPYS